MTYKHFPFLAIMSATFLFLGGPKAQAREVISINEG